MENVAPQLRADAERIRTYGSLPILTFTMTDPIATTAAAMTDDGPDCGQPEASEEGSSSMSSSAAGERRLTLLNGMSRFKFYFYNPPYFILPFFSSFRVREQVLPSSSASKCVNINYHPYERPVVVQRV